MQTSQAIQTTVLANMSPYNTSIKVSTGNYLSIKLFVAFLK